MSKSDFEGAGPDLGRPLGLPLLPLGNRLAAGGRPGPTRPLTLASSEPVRACRRSSRSSLVRILSIGLGYAQEDQRFIGISGIFRFDQLLHGPGLQWLAASNFSRFSI